MASIGMVQSVSASVLRAADQNTAVAISMLKTATDADKNLVNTLLPPGGVTGRVNIAA
jgi:hypothetical protein